METETESPIKVVHFPQELNMEDILCRSILLLGPVLNTGVELHTYVEDALKVIAEKTKGIPHHVPLDQLVITFNPYYKQGQDDKEYDQWVNRQIEYHSVPDPGRVTLLIIPKSHGKVVDNLRGYAKHTSFELGQVSTNNKLIKSNVVICIENGAPEEKYYRNNLDLNCPNLLVHSSIDESIEEAFMLATVDGFVSTQKSDDRTLIAQST